MSAVRILCSYCLTEKGFGECLSCIDGVGWRPGFEPPTPPPPPEDDPAARIRARIQAARRRQRTGAA